MSLARRAAVASCIVALAAGSLAAVSRAWAIDAAPAPALVALISVPGGTFMMGVAKGSPEARQHQVTLSPFCIGKTEISYAQWKKVYDWAVAHGYYFDPAGKGNLGGRYHGNDPVTETDSRHPVTRVGWWECITWCNALSEMEGRTPCYYTGGTAPVVFRGAKKPVWDASMSVRWDVDGYRLPTEAEWEYACRAGADTNFSWGNDVAATGQFANVFDETAQAKYAEKTYVKTTDGFADTAPVGSLKPNAFGVYDMSGNVWEWCFDLYGPYGADPVVNPHGPDEGTTRARRGGCFQNRSLFDVMSTSRNRHDYDDRGQLGFRVAASVPASK